MRTTLRKTVASLIGGILLCVTGAAVGVETLFTGYFDIKTGSTSGNEVIGKINLLRNKDAHLTPVPANYSFSIVSDPSGIFELVNQRDSASRLFGMLRVKPGQTVSASPVDYPLSIVLSDGAVTLATASISIHAKSQTLHEGFLSYAKTHCVAEDRLYGRTRYTDTVVGTLITEVETNGGRLNGFDFYTRTVASYVNTGSNLTTQWEQAGAKIGGLGYAYLKSAKYGPTGTATDRLRLKNALYSALAAFIDRVPINPAEVVINGQPIGTDLGDGVFRLNEKGIMSFNDLSHQWTLTDPLTGPAVWLMSDLLADARNGDAAAIALHEKLVKFFQINFGNPMGYRQPNSPGARWGQLTDTNHTEGAFSDANLGHRFRGWLTMPAIWSDYNRPITYIPYWYDGYYSSFPGFQYRPGWTPHGVLDDYLFWAREIFNPSHEYTQSGFHPDGTITHHSSYGSGIAMAAYGHEWLTDSIPNQEMLKNSGLDLGSGIYNHIANHYLRTYDKLIFKGDFDYTLCGRSYYDDYKNSLVKGIPGTIDRLIASKQPTTQIDQQQALVTWRNALAGGTHQATGNFPFWVSNFMVHRRGGGTANPDSFYFSVKMANDVTEAPDDFASVGKSYLTGNGILQTKLTGTEYDVDVRKRMDWHALPGLTEEWRTDAIPTDNRAQTTGSPYAGMASDGTCGFSAMRYRPGTTETYAVAQADKGFFFTGNRAIALGSNVARRATGQNRPIITTLDQTRWTGDLTYSVNLGTPVTIIKGTSTDASISLSGPTWIHQGRTGYLIFPQGTQPLYIRGGAPVVDTDPDTSTASVIHFAVGHGTDPVAAGLTRYHYVIVPDISAAEMPDCLTQTQTNIEVVNNAANVQGIYDHENNVVQLAFHAAAFTTLSNGLQIAVDRPALVQLRRNGTDWEVCATDPIHDYQATAINITLNAAVKAGTYSHTLPGYEPRPGEDITVTEESGGMRIHVPLPDPTDDANLGYQAKLYASVPIHVTIPMESTPSNPIHHWKLDETTGTTALDSAGDVPNGTVLNGTWVAGQFDNGLSLSGTGSRVTANSLGISTNTLTLSCWIKRNGTQTAFSGIAFSRASGVASGLHLGTANELRYTWNNQAPTYNWNPGLIVPDNVWTFVALVVTPTGGTLYMDSGAGLVSASQPLAVQVENFTPAPFCIGADTHTGSRSFKGTIDDVRVFDTALNAEQVRLLSRTWPPIPELAAIPNDLDGNGLPDKWEARYFSSSGQDPEADPDQDGLSNRSEQALGTDPIAADTDKDGTNDKAESRLGIDPLDSAQRFTATITPDQSGWELRWPGNVGCTFKIERSGNLGGWTTLEESWPGSADGCHYLDYPPSDLKQVFYRVSLVSE